MANELISSIKTVRRGRDIQQEGESRIRQLLPKASKVELELVVGTLETLMDKADEATAAPQPKAKSNGKAKKQNGKGKPFNRDKILKRFLALKVQPYTSQELAKEVGLPTAQPLSPLMTSLKRNKAMKRRVNDGKITWEPIRKGLKAYIKFCEEEAQAA